MPPIGKRSIVMSVSVCLFVCPQAYLPKYASDLYQIFVHVTYGRTFGPPLTVSEYIMYFRFYG